MQSNVNVMRPIVSIWPLDFAIAHFPFYECTKIKWDWVFGRCDFSPFVCGALTPCTPIIKKRWMSFGLNNILVQYCQNEIKGALSIVPNQVFALIVSGISGLVNCTSFDGESRRAAFNLNPAFIRENWPFLLKFQDFEPPHNKSSSSSSLIFRIRVFSCNEIAWEMEQLLLVWPLQLFAPSFYFNKMSTNNNNTKKNYANYPQCISTIGLTQILTHSHTQHTYTQSTEQSGFEMEFNRYSTIPPFTNQPNI